MLDLVAEGHTSKEIAARLGISESAVNQRLEAIRHRVGGLPRAEIARRWRQGGGSEDPETCNPLTGKIIEVPPAIPLADEPEREGLVAPRSEPAGATQGSQGSQPSQHAEIFDFAIGDLIDGPNAVWWRLASISLIAALSLTVVWLCSAILRQFTWVGTLPKEIPIHISTMPHGALIDRFLEIRDLTYLYLFIAPLPLQMAFYIYCFSRSQFIEKIQISIIICNIAIVGPISMYFHLAHLDTSRYFGELGFGDIIADLIPQLIYVCLALVANRWYIIMYASIGLEPTIRGFMLLSLHKIDWLPGLVSLVLLGNISNLIFCWGVWSNRRRAMREGPIPNWLSEVRRQQGQPG